MERREDVLNCQNPSPSSKVSCSTHQDRDYNMDQISTPKGSSGQQKLNRDDTFLVQFHDGDLDNPRNFNNYYKAWLTFQMSMICLAGSLGSSIMAPTESTIAKYLNVSHEITVLSVSLFVLGSSDEASPR